MNRILRIVVLGLFFIAFFVQNISAQTVGVVLSGGGAKGLYHIGILQALEENNIPIDYVTGTSMGAIVGAMYSVGMSPEEILAVFKSGDVEKWLSGKIENKYRYYYKQSEPNGSMLSLNVDLRSFLEKRKNVSEQENQLQNAINERERINLDQERQFRAVIPSVQLDIAMLDYFAPSTEAAHHNFDSLFVPFRCVSVDILKREEYLWKKGDLGMAVRSSMAIPLVFKPMVIDSMMMFDGGILNNFPWKEMRDDFQPDVMVGGICTGDYIDPATFAGQISLLTMAKTDYDIPDSLGVKIYRDVPVGVLDYNKVDFAVKLGYDDAMELMPKILERIERRVTVGELAEKRLKFKEKSPTLVIDKLKVKGLTESQTNYVEKQINLHKESAIDFEQFKQEYFKIIDGGLIGGDFPTATYDPMSGYYTVNMNMVARSSFKGMVGANISSSNINEGFVGFQYSRVRKISSTHTLQGYLGNFYSSANYMSRFNFYAQKLPYYVTLNLNYSYLDYGRGNSQRYAFNSIISDYSRMNGFFFSSAIGMAVNRTTKLELRGSVGRDVYKFDTPGEYIVMYKPNYNRYNYASINLSLSRNSHNFIVYPTAGLQQSINLITTHGGSLFVPATISEELLDVEYINRDTWYGASFSRDNYIRVFSNFTLGYSIDAIVTSLPQFKNDYFSKLVAPGFNPTEHSKTLFIPEFHDRSFAAIGVKPIIEWNDNLYLKTEGFVYYPNLESYKKPMERLRYMLSSTLVYQSPIGPVSFNYSYYENSYLPKSYYTLNIGYILFNRRGINYFD